MARRMLDFGVYGVVPFDCLFEMFYDLKDGNSLKIYQTKTLPSLGSWVYDAAVCLANYLESTEFCKHNLRRASFEGTTLLELGAGTGLVGLVASCYGAQVVVTDLEPLLPLIKLNVSENISMMKVKPISMPLTWGSEEMITEVLCSIQHQSKNEIEERQCFDIVILANCIYYESSLELLLETILSLVGMNSFVLACYEERTSHIKTLIEKWHSMALKHFTIENVQLDASDMTKKHFTDCVKVVIMKPTSLSRNN